MSPRRYPRDTRYAPNDRLFKLWTARGKKRTHRLERKEGRRAVDEQRRDLGPGE